MGRQSVSGIRRKVARGLQNLQASRRLSLLRFMGIQSVRPCTLLQPFSLSPPDAPTVPQQHSCTHFLKDDRQWTLVGDVDVSPYAVYCKLALFLSQLPCHSWRCFHAFFFFSSSLRRTQTDLGKDRQADRHSDRSVSDWMRLAVSPISAWLCSLIGH